MWYSPVKHSGMAGLNEGSQVLPATHTFIHKWNESYLPLIPSRSASPHFVRFSFPIPLRVGDWVSLGSWLHTKVVTYPSTNQPRYQTTTREGNASIQVKIGKEFPYSLPSVGRRADPGVQAVSPQVTISHPPGGRLPLISARPAVTFPAAEHHRPLAGTHFTVSRRVEGWVDSGHLYEVVQKGVAKDMFSFWTASIQGCSKRQAYPLLKHHEWMKRRKPFNSALHIQYMVGDMA